MRFPKARFRGLQCVWINVEYAEYVGIYRSMCNCLRLVPNRCCYARCLRVWHIQFEYCLFTSPASTSTLSGLLFRFFSSFFSAVFSFLVCSWQLATFTCDRRRPMISNRRWPKKQNSRKVDWMRLQTVNCDSLIGTLINKYSSVFQSIIRRHPGGSSENVGYDAF